MPFGKISSSEEVHLETQAIHIPPLLYLRPLFTLLIQTTAFLMSLWQSFCATTEIRHSQLTEESVLPSESFLFSLARKERVRPWGTGKPSGSSCGPPELRLCLAQTPISPISHPPFPHHYFGTQFIGRPAVPNRDCYKLLQIVLLGCFMNQRCYGGPPYSRCPAWAHLTE
jgi:hypothetical protein